MDIINIDSQIYKSRSTLSPEELEKISKKDLTFQALSWYENDFSCSLENSDNEDFSTEEENKKIKALEEEIKKLKLQEEIRILKTQIQLITMTGDHNNINDKKLDILRLGILKKDNERLKEDYERLKEDYERLKEDNERLKEDNERLKEDNERLKEDNERLKEDNGKLKEDNGKLKEDGFLYVLYNEMFGENIYKVGCSKDPKSRLKNFVTGYLKPSKLLYVSQKFDNKLVAEKKLFKSLNEYRLEENREFFKLELNLIIENIKFIENNK